MSVLRRFINSIKNTPQGVLAVCFTTLFVAISSTATYAITPFFLKDTLGLNLVAIGLIEAGTEALSQFARLLAGIVSDKLKRCKPMFLLGTIFSFLAKPLMIFAQGSFSVLLSKTSDRLGNGFSATPRDAYIALHSKDDKGANIGLTMTFKTIGCVIGPFIVMAVMSIPYFAVNPNWRLLLCFTAIPALLAVFICWKYMTEKQYSESFIKKNSFKWQDICALSADFKLFLLIMFVFMLARSPEAYLVLNLRESGLPEWFCAGAIGFFNLVSVMISYPIGKLSDKYDRITVLMVSFITLALSVFCFTTKVGFLCVLGVIFWGIQRASSQIISVSYIADIVDKKILGTAIGLLNVVSAIAGIIAVSIMGSISKTYSIAIGYYSSTAFAVLAIAGLLWYKIRKRRISSKSI